MGKITVLGMDFTYELENDKAIFEGACLTKKGMINIYRLDGSTPSYEVFYSSFDILSCKDAISELIDFLLKKLLGEFESNH